MSVLLFLMLLNQYGRLSLCSSVVVAAVRLGVMILVLEIFVSNGLFLVTLWCAISLMILLVGSRK